MSSWLGRSLSRRSRGGYERLDQGRTKESEEHKPKVVEMLGSPSFRKQGSKNNRSHPLMNLADASRQKKAMAKPEFIRYLEYVKEGGMWEHGSDGPVIYFK